MPKYVLVTNDIGDSTRITNTIIQHNDFEGGPGYYLTRDKKLFQKIRDLLVHNIVEFDNPLEGELIFEDLNIIQKDSFTELKDRTFTKAMEYMNSRLKVASVLDVYEYINYNNILIDKGYFITDENRMAKYLEIVETGDEELFQILEKYLELKDRLNEGNMLNNIWLKFKNTVTGAVTKEEIDTAYKEFVMCLE